MRSRSPLAAASAIVCLSLGALSAYAQTSATASVSAEAKPVTVPTPMGPHLNESPSTVVTGTIEGITDKGPAAATANLNGDFKTAKPAAPTKASIKRPKGAKVTAKGVAKALTAAKPAASAKKPEASAPAQANANLDAKVQTN